MTVMKNKQTFLWGCIGIPILLVLASYLAGVFYFWSYFDSANSVTPLTYLEQFYYYHHLLTFRQHLAISGFLGVLVAFGLPAVALYFHFKEPPESLHGDARWATEPEIEKRKLMTDKGEGVVLGGKVGGRILTYVGDAFLFLLSPTRGGKGISVIIPTLLNWQESLVCTDIKLENWSITSKFRKWVLRQEVFLLNPFAEDGKTHRYNPLTYVRGGALGVTDIQRITAAFYPVSSSAKGNEKFFSTQARNLFLALALMVKETDGMPFTIGEIVRQSSGGGKPLPEFFKGIIEKRDKSRPFSQVALNTMYDVMALSEETLSGVVGSFKAPLENWLSPIFDAATSTSDFDLRDLRRKRMTIYVGIPADYLPVAQEFLNIFFDQLVSVNTTAESLPSKNPEFKHKCLLLMDEFAALGRVNALAHGVSHIAGYGFRLLTVIQDIGQVYKHYGKEDGDNLVNNHSIHLIHTVSVRNQREADSISKALGTKTVTAVSKQRGLGWSGKSNPTNTESDQRRPLMFPHELTSMDYWQEIIMQGGTRPILCEKLGYFKEPAFLNRLKQVSPTLRNSTHSLEKEAFEAIISAGEFSVEPPLVTDDLRSVPKPTEDVTKAWQENKAKFTETGEVLPLSADDVARELTSSKDNVEGTKVEPLPLIDTTVINSTDFNELGDVPMF